METVRAEPSMIERDQDEQDLIEAPYKLRNSMAPR